MLRWTIIFLIVAIVAGILGFGGIAAGAAGIAKILFFVFLVLFVLSLLSRGQPLSASAERPRGEESPGSTEARCRITSGGGDPRESATEIEPPVVSAAGKGEKVR
jgi:uncharacterized membrane protein YtjA (UPF0391 family)